jgi:hypothetical protein
MTMRLSTGLRNFLAKQGSYDDAMRNGILEIYSGAQPASADAAPSGTLLCTISSNAGTVTPEVLATGTVTLAGAAGSVNTITVNSVEVLGGAVPFNGTLAQTALDVAAQINRNKTAPDYTAAAVGAVVTLTALPGTGASPNTYAVAGTLTTLTATYSALAGGVAPVNGLKFDSPVAGALPKLATQVWSGANAATGTAGWFREYGSVADSKALDAAGTMIRVDGAIATSGAEMNLNNTAFVSGAITTLASASLTIPAQ